MQIPKEILSDRPQCGGQRAARSCSLRMPCGVHPLTFEDLLERLGGLFDRVLGEERLHVGDLGRAIEQLHGVDHAADRVAREPLRWPRPSCGVRSSHDCCAVASVDRCTLAAGTGRSAS